MAAPSSEELKKAIKDILKGADLDTLSAKKVRKLLEDKFSVDLNERKKEIDSLVMKMIEDEGDDDDDAGKKDSKKAEGNDQNGVSEEGSDVESEEEVPKKKAKKSAAPTKSKKKKSARKADDSEDPVMSSVRQMDDEDLAKKLQDEESGLRSRRAAAPKPKKEREKHPEKKKKTSLYSRPCHLSEPLAAVVGSNEMPRPEVVKTLWSVVKERKLQDPANKQFMICDSQMEGLFGVKRVKLFGMMKYLKKHITDLPR
ncbi:unnamed protein product [Candidula unifasciata]|uniref:Upstream activation factor subunit spp27 n=1 Tax=Candidula unifasciata TaxID=100452 RepID=A0A8S3YT70_9EUPU|nr:unnamed protein product [Candidula unifasciata]